MPAGFSHQPSDYACPFCAIVAGRDNADNWTKQADVVLRDEAVTAFVAAGWWPANDGHVLVVPNEHYENVYDIPDAILAAVQIAGKRIAVALKATYDCDGTSFRQHNEPAGNQDVWHYHLHVFPRYPGDDLYLRSGQKRLTTPSERAPYAEKLRRYLTSDQ
jgi:histidine triad (HIT) family protein